MKLNPYQEKKRTDLLRRKPEYFRFRFPDEYEVLIGERRKEQKRLITKNCRKNKKDIQRLEKEKKDLENEKKSLIEEINKYAIKPESIYKSNSIQKRSEGAAHAGKASMQ